MAIETREIGYRVDGRTFRGYLADGSNGKKTAAVLVAHEGGVNEPTARDLVKIGEKVRNLKGHGLEEGVSTRLLVYAGQMIARGVDPVTACEVAIASPITDDPELQRSIREIVTTVI